MVDCVQPGGQDYTLEEIILRIVGDLHVPVAFGLRSGHVSSRNITLPLGIRASLAVESGTVVLRILETSVAGVSALARTPQA
jgi:muramoyltetrapeptide carboxypeptidase